MLFTAHRAGRIVPSGPRISLCHWPCAVIASLFLILGTVAAAQAEFVLSAYGGKASTRSNDLELVQPGRLHLTFHDVSWADESFTDPPYYGLRGAFYLPRLPSLGFAIDFTHAKTILQNREVVRVTGTRRGSRRMGRSGSVILSNDLSYHMAIICSRSM